MATNSGFSIKQETLARRCEICHQSDSFIPETNHCSRCDGVPTLPEPSPAAVIPVETPMFLRSYVDPDQQADEVFSERFVMATVTPYMLFTFGVLSKELGFPRSIGALLAQLAFGLFLVLPVVGIMALGKGSDQRKSQRNLFFGTLIASGPLMFLFYLIFVAVVFGGSCGN